MTTNKIAFRYAKSWIDLAVERNEVESALADAQVLKNLLRENADFSAFVFTHYSALAYLSTYFTYFTY